jgi:hypothetical protein
MIIEDRPRLDSFRTATRNGADRVDRTAPCESFPLYFWDCYLKRNLMAFDRLSRPGSTQQPSKCLLFVSVYSID